MLKDSIEHHRLGRFAEAERGYRARLAEQPDDVDALQLLGMLRYQLGDSGEGRRLVERAQALAPENPGVILTLASMCFRDGDHEGARRGFHQALALGPQQQRAGEGGDRPQQREPPEALEVLEEVARERDAQHARGASDVKGRDPARQQRAHGGEVQQHQGQGQQVVNGGHEGRRLKMPNSSAPLDHSGIQA